MTRYGELSEESFAMSTAVKAFLNSPVGPKTTHFWGPVANWGFVLAVSCNHILVCVSVCLLCTSSMPCLCIVAATLISLCITVLLLVLSDLIQIKEF